MKKLNRATVLLLCVLIVMLVNFPISRVVAEGMSGDDLFKFVWDDYLGSYPVFGGYYIVSDKVFPLKVYIINLPTIGSYRLSNHSDVVEGVRQAVDIDPRSGEVKELRIHLWFTKLVAKLEVNVSCVIVEDWYSYKAIVESDNNTIIVNTHDEYLPVPEGYTKEEWTDKIADFMLNRWGTWVHAGGYPLYRIWHQNGTKEEWGENGFKRLMSHIGKPNVTCQPPPDWNPLDRTTFMAQWLFGWYDKNGNSILRYAEANKGYPLNQSDFQDLYISVIYGGGDYDPGVVIRFSQNESTFNFGVYVHMTPWEFYLGNGKEVESSDLANGFISTAAAIYSEFFYAADKLYGRAGDSASEAIQKAEREGRTIGLAEAKSHFQNALDAFASGNYKLSAAYAMQAKQVAEKATAPNTLPQTIVIITTIIAVPMGIGAYYKIKNKGKNKKEGVTECAE